MNPPKKLLLPNRPVLLPKSQKRSVIATGISSTVAASLAVGALALALFLFPLVSTLSEERSPVQVVTSPAISPEKTVENPPPKQRQRAALPSAPPQHLNRNDPSLTPSHKPTLTTLPQGSPPSSQQLSIQSASQLEFLAAFAEEEAVRLAQLAQQEAAEREVEALARAEEARKAQELAKTRAQQAAEKSRLQKELATIQAEEKRQRDAISKQTAEANRKNALAKRVASAPSVISKKVPSYPSSARRAGWQGTTRITATVSSNGKVSSAYVSQSSGHQSLDKSALSSVKRWRFSPARNGLGEAIAHQVVVPIPFQLN